MDHEDVVAEAFLKVLRQLNNGGGPTENFRAYLVSTVRNTVAQWGRESRESTTEYLNLILESEAEADFSHASLDGMMLRDAFKSLPQRWQDALWQTEIMGDRAAELGEELNLSPNTAAALVFRAKEGLKRAWIAQHVNHRAERPECQSIIQDLPAYARNSLSKKATMLVEQHLAGCADCTRLKNQALLAASQLKAALLPTILAGATVGSLATAAGAGTESASAASLATQAAPTKTLFGLGIATPKAILTLAAGVTIVLAGVSVYTLFPGQQGSDLSTSDASGTAEQDSVGQATVPDSNTGTSTITETTSDNDSDVSTQTVFDPVSETTDRPAPPSFNIADGTSIHAAGASLDGAALPGATITVFLSAEDSTAQVESVSANEIGAWSLPITGAVDSEWTARAYQTNSEGQRSEVRSISFSLNGDGAMSAPVIAGIDTDGGRLAPIVHGTAIPGNQVQVLLNGVAMSTKVRANGTWQIQLDEGSIVGANHLTAVQQIPKSLRQSPVSMAESFELRAPSGSVIGGGAGSIRLSVSADPDQSILVTAKNSGFRYLFSSDSGSRTLTLDSRSNTNPINSDSKLQLRYASADGSRLGPVAPAQN